jgi:glycosyltransferase involved in cell wall biosynthesis
VPHRRIPLHVRAADAFVLNSRYEGLSHTLLEVQALGTPIIASNVCGNPEVVEHGVNGLLVDPHSPNDLREALRRLLSDRALGRRFVEAGFARRDDFRRDLTFAEVEAQLARLARGTGSRSTAAAGAVDPG